MIDIEEPSTPDAQAIDDNGDNAGSESRRQRKSRDQSAQRRERAAAKLRENLLRRKNQARARRAGDADETDGLPAARVAVVEKDADN
jgi:hypothetical protein